MGIDGVLPRAAPSLGDLWDILCVVAVDSVMFIETACVCDLFLGLQDDGLWLKLPFSSPGLFSRSGNRLHCENRRGSGLCG